MSVLQSPKPKNRNDGNVGPMQFEAGFVLEPDETKLLNIQARMFKQVPLAWAGAASIRSKNSRTVAWEEA